MGYIMSCIFIVGVSLGINPEFNAKPADKLIKKIDGFEYNDTLFHLVPAQYYLLPDFHCNLFFHKGEIAKVAVFAIHPHLLYERTYYFKHADIFAVVEHNYRFEKYEFLGDKNVRDLNRSVIEGLPTFKAVELNNYYFTNDSLVSFVGADTFLLDQPQMLLNQANGFLQYYRDNLMDIQKN